MKNKLALTLLGEVPISEFASAMGHFASLIEALTCEVGNNAVIEWKITKLEAGSATTEITGISTNTDAIERIIKAYETLSISLQNNDIVPFSDHVVNEAKAITNLINEKIHKVEFITDGFAASIDKSIEFEETKYRDYSFGTLTGKVETLSKRGKMRFVLYDSLFDRAVTCYLAIGQEELMLNAWDKYVRVAGQIYRDPIQGRPIDIKEINYIEILSDETINILSLSGIVPWENDQEHSEDSIRRVRDGK